MKRLFLIAFALLSGCIEEDIAVGFLVEGHAAPLLLTAGEARSFVCVVAICRASPGMGQPELADSFEPWSVAPLTDRVGETAIEHRALYNAGECRGAGIREASGSSGPWQYIEVARPMIAYDHGGNVAVFDPQRGIFIAISG